MKESELRIGNWVKVSDVKGPIQVSPLGEGLDFNFIFIGGNREVKPIPLTEEWLIKFGFYKNENGEPEIQTGHERGLSISMSDNPYKYTAWHVLLTEFRYYPMNDRIEYVHQLQNLYHSLTGEELTKKEAVENEN